MEALDPRVRLVWLASVLVVVAVLGAIVVAIDHYVLDISRALAGVVIGIAVALGVAYVLVRYRIWGFEVNEEDLYIERGVLTRIDSVVPYVRVQHIDTQRGPVERLIGLSSVVVYTAGSRGADITIPGLSPERADDLREQLRGLAVESGEDGV